jgi:hypothetical protein
MGFQFGCLEIRVHFRAEKRLVGGEGSCGRYAGYCSMVQLPLFFIFERNAVCAEVVFQYA